MPSSLFSLLRRPGRAEGGGYIPLTDINRPRKSWWEVPQLARNGSPTCTALGLALLAGIFVCFAISSFIRRPEYVFALPSDSNEYTSSIFAAPTVISDTENLSLEALKNIVARGKGYWARDYSLNLGWNNVSPYGSNFQYLLTITFRCGI